MADWIIAPDGEELSFSFGTWMGACGPAAILREAIGIDYYSEPPEYVLMRAGGAFREDPAERGQWRRKPSRENVRFDEARVSDDVLSGLESMLEDDEDRPDDGHDLLRCVAVPKSTGRTWSGLGFREVMETIPPGLMVVAWNQDGEIVGVDAGEEDSAQTLGLVLMTEGLDFDRFVLRVLSSGGAVVAAGPSDASLHTAVLLSPEEVRMDVLLSLAANLKARGKLDGYIDSACLPQSDSSGSSHERLEALAGITCFLVPQEEMSRRGWGVRT